MDARARAHLDNPTPTVYVDTMTSPTPTETIVTAPIIDDQPAQSDDSVNHRACLPCNGVDIAAFWMGLQGWPPEVVTLCGLKMAPGYTPGLQPCPLCTEFYNQAAAASRCPRCGNGIYR